MLTLIKNGTVITMDEKRNNIYEKLDILIDDNIIKEISENYSGEYDKLIDAEGKIVMPGLINAHTHLGMSIFRATNDNMKLDDWLNNKIWPIEAKLTDEDIYYSTMLSCIEMIKTGTTTSNDMYISKNGMLKAINQMKVRNVFPLYFIGEYDEEKFKEEEKFYLENKNNNLLTFAVAPHSFYTCSEKLIESCKDMADKYNLLIHIHFCETEDEVKIIKEKYNLSPAQVLQKFNMLDNKLILAHGTFIDKDDQKILKKNVSIVHNPLSNLNLGCGIAPIKEYLDNSINVCLGTDGQGSGNNLNMFYHMSLVDNLQKGINKNSNILSSYDVLKMATINGAKALGLENEIGSIEINKKADIIILNYDNIENSLHPDLISNIVHNTESINADTTIIDGNILMENHKLLLNIDENELKEKLNNIINKRFI